ncbi:MAG: hypothetical protein PHR35_07245, partial [Kiritimatiellae bacterium]|nr:hypothetical protein [Kiritimatiellia bacterium]
MRGTAGAEKPWEAKPDIAGIVSLVSPLEHPMPAGWHPTLFWWQAPLSFTNPAALKTELQALADRGLAPCVGLDAEYGVPPEKVARQIADAKAIADAGFPVHIQLIGVLDLYVTADGKRVRHPEAPDAEAKDAVGSTFPCLPLKDGWIQRGEFITGLMKKFAAANVPVAAVWVDYEGHPHPWNGVFDASRKCAGCTNVFPQGVVSDPTAFHAWTCEAHAEALATTFAKPVRAAFPKALTGFYG